MPESGPTPELAAGCIDEAEASHEPLSASSYEELAEPLVSTEKAGEIHEIDRGAGCIHEAEASHEPPRDLL